MKRIAHLPKNGFTLVELLVVMSIMAITGIFTLSNFRSFGEDQNLKSAVLDLQSQLRSAQTNATANAICINNGGGTWQVTYSGSTASVNCQEAGAAPAPTSVPKTVTLGSNIQIEEVSGIPSSSCPNSAAVPFTISFNPLSGNMRIGNSSACSSLSIGLMNSKTGTRRFLTVEQGGKIYSSNEMAAPPPTTPPAACITVPALDNGIECQVTGYNDLPLSLPQPVIYMDCPNNSSPEYLVLTSYCNKVNTYNPTLCSLPPPQASFYYAIGDTSSTTGKFGFNACTDPAIWGRVTIRRRN